MKKIIFLFLLCSICFAQSPEKPIPLVIEGETIVVVKNFPFKIIASPGADFYSWSIPDSLKSSSLDNITTITNGSKGSYKISVTSITIDIDFESKKKKIIKTNQEIEVNIGEVKPPEPPLPPVPIDPMVKSFRDAFLVSPGTDSSKREDVKKLSALYSQAVNLLDQPTIKTAGDLSKALANMHSVMISIDAIKPVRVAISQELLKMLPTNSAEPYGDPPRIKNLFLKISKCLLECIQ